MMGNHGLYSYFTKEELRQAYYDDDAHSAIYLSKILPDQEHRNRVLNAISEIKTKYPNQFSDIIKEYDNHKIFEHELMDEIARRYFQGEADDSDSAESMPVCSSRIIYDPDRGFFFEEDQ